jgi:uncharacterized protein
VSAGLTCQHGRVPRILSYLLTAVAVVVLLRLLVIWLEPRMAFFPVRGVQQTPAAFGVRYEDVMIRTDDGETLHAWWLARDEPRGQVLFWHGNGGNLSMWLPPVLEAHRRGFSVLTVDYRGYGASTGRPSEAGVYRDAEAAVRLFTARLRQPGSPVIYWGRSLGSTIAAYTVGVHQPDAVVLESPMPDVGAVLRTNPILWVLGLLSSYRFPTSEFLEAYEGPLLVIHGDADSIIPFKAGQRVYERAPTTQKTFVALAGADHNDPYYLSSPVYWEAIDAFLAGLER